MINFVANKILLYYIIKKSYKINDIKWKKKFLYKNNQISGYNTTRYKF